MTLPLARAADGGRRPGRLAPRTDPRGRIPWSPEIPLGRGETVALTVGACVRVSLSGGRTPWQMTEEGVVIEVVEADAAIRSARVAYIRAPLAGERRYVIQCWSRRVLRGPDRLVVVSA